MKTILSHFEKICLRELERYPALGFSSITLRAEVVCDGSGPGATMAENAMASLVRKGLAEVHPSKPTMIRISVEGIKELQS